MPTEGRRKPSRSLNAPSGAGCSLTLTADDLAWLAGGLNAPSGAGCSLTLEMRGYEPYFVEES